jgi:Glycosyl hydrolases family 39
MQKPTNFHSLQTHLAALCSLVCRDVGLTLCIISALMCCGKVPAQVATTEGKRDVSVIEQTFTADASRWSGAPLVKDKFGVYQTPLRGLKTILKSTPYLSEAQVRDIRYEMGIGKPDALAWDQITGTKTDLRYDFGTFDALVNSWKSENVQPLIAVTYCPLPLQPADGSEAWKYPPESMSAWKEINKAYAAHLRNDLHVKGSWFEEWNEPDLSISGKKTFFIGSPEQYRQVFEYGASGIHDGDPAARAGGPAVAYNLAYLSKSGILANPDLNFVSIHAYANYSAQLNRLRSEVIDRAELPLLLTEYASYSTFGLNTPISRHDAAATFFADVNGLLQFQDVPKVYWAQWVDDSLGMLTNGLHRKAIYNAYLLYQTMLPADRVKVTQASRKETGAMAGADEHSAAIVVWNNGNDAVNANVRITNLPFQFGSVRQWFIDKDHASYLDQAPELLTPGGDRHEPLRSGTAQWRGLLLPHSVVFVQASDDSGQSLLSTHRIGAFIRSYYWYKDRLGTSYADFDPHTSIARLGMGRKRRGLAQIGNVYEEPADSLGIQIKTQGRLVDEDKNSLFGIRVDFRNRSGVYDRSVLFCNRICGRERFDVLPWGEKTASPDQTIHQPEMESGRAFTFRLSSIAPEDWDRNGIIVTPILQDAGSNASVRILIRPESTEH